MTEPQDPKSNEPLEVSWVVCPHCGHGESIRVSTLIMNRRRHLHCHCPCCRHVWVESERRFVERLFDYQPPMAK